ncbi:MAG: ribonuclease J, partial [Bacilli bacterium]|nr:ribonuclease J [Bacilli bacterium]
VMGIAREYGYIKIPDSSVIEETMLRNYKLQEVCILCTGSQGEPMAALSRIVNGDNHNTTIYPGDTVVFSSNPIPGNGALVDKLVNKLVKMGADVKQNSLAFSLHSSGHPSRQELRLLQRLVQPKNFMPVHGEYRMLKLHGEIAVSLGMDPEKVFVCDNGDTLVLENHKVTRGGHIQAANIYIDGNDLDGLSSATINDRGVLKNDGVITVLLAIDGSKNKMTVEPIVYARGFSAASSTSHVIRHSQMNAKEAVEEMLRKRADASQIRSAVKSVVSKYVERKTGRSPMVVPIVMMQ